MGAITFQKTARNTEAARQITSKIDFFDRIYLKSDHFFLYATDQNHVLVAFALCRANVASILEIPIFQVNEVEVLVPFLNYIVNSAQEYSGIQLIYKGGQKEDILDGAFESLGWSEPENYKIRCFFNGLTFRAPWIDKPVRLPPQYTIAPWKEINQEELALIERWKRQNLVHFSVSPHQEQAFNSLVLRDENRLIGWMATRLVKKDLLDYTALWVHPSHRGLGPAVALLSRSIQMQIEAQFKDSVAEINYEFIPSNWATFFLKRLVPYAERTDYYYSTFKTITN